MFIFLLLVALTGSNGYVMTFQDSNSLIVGVDEPPVLVELYYESLCPGCRNFITTQLFPTWQKLQDTGVMEVKLYPYGNAHQSQKPDGRWEFTCQHGAPECLGNLLEVCVMKHLDMDSALFLPVISCMEGSDDPVSSVRGCVRDLAPSLPFRPIKDCTNGEEGNELLHEMGVATESLDPAHNYVPWVVVNKEHTDQIEEAAMANLLGLVCQEYKGKKPSVCSEQLAVGPVVSSVEIKKDWATK